MPLFVIDNQLLVVSNQLAVHANCCCEEECVFLCTQLATCLSVTGTRAFRNATVVLSGISNGGDCPTGDCGLYNTTYPFNSVAGDYTPVGGATCSLRRVIADTFDIIGSDVCGDAIHSMTLGIDLFESVGAFNGATIFVTVSSGGPAFSLGFSSGEYAEFCTWITDLCAGTQKSIPATTSAECTLTSASCLLQLS